MKYLNFLLLPTFTCLSLVACDTQTEPQKKTGFIIANDDSGVLSEPDRARDLKLTMLAQLKDLRTKRNYAKAKLKVISSSFGRSVFVGSIEDLSSNRAENIVSKMESNSTYCNRLPETFESVRSSIKQLEQQGYEDIYVYFFSSLISTPSVCVDKQRVELPQLPVPVNFSNTLTSSDAVSAISFYYVNPHNFKAYQEALQPVATWANENNKSFQIFDMEDTAYQLRTGLLGVK